MNTFFSRIKNNLGLASLMILAAFMNIYNIWSLGFGNSYYAAGIKSMLTSWSNFFFVSFDGSGFISIDKAPLSLWVDTAFAKIFGFSGIAILLPHALEGIAVTFLVYKIIQKVAGKIPAFLAGLFIALSPVNIAVYRNNTPDSLLLVFMLLTIWFFVKFFEQKKLRYLLITALMIGLGFNTKMLQAFLILPAMIVSLLLFLPGTLFSKIKTLSLFLFVTAIVSFSWITIVDLTPANLRPYMGGSANDSAWNLALGYNGAERLLGEGSVGGNAGFNVGSKGFHRLFTGEMGTQTGWFLVSVLFYSTYFIIRRFKKLIRSLIGKYQEYTLQEIVTFLSILFFLTGFVFFSFASFFHSYYLNILALPMALIMGGLFYEFAESQWKSKLLFGMLFASLPLQIYLITPANYAPWLIPAILAVGIMALIFVLFPINRFIKYASVTALFASLFLTPFMWSSYTTVTADTAQPIFIGGPKVAGSAGGFGPGQGGGQMPSMNAGGPMGGGFGSESVSTTILNYLKQNYNGEKYFVAVLSQGEATGFILNNNITNVMTLGGFSGRDKAITLTALKQKINDGEIRFFLLSNGRDGGGGPMGGAMNTDGKTGNGGMFNANQDITNWVKANCKSVSGISGLYDCKV